jgi:pilus assembly protein CpaE
MAKNKTVLIADDSIDTLRLTGLIFHRGGYEVQTARSGAEALQKVESLRPDLLILDVMMGDISGLDVCQQVRANPAIAQTPIIMVSAKSFIDDRLSGFHAGADDYVAKPADPQELLARAKALLQRSHYGQKRTSRIITFVGAKGGVGVTTVALNTAAMLVSQGKSVILLELRAHRGSLALFLGLNTPQDLCELLSLETDAVTRKEVTSRLVRHPTGLRLLLAPQQPTTQPLTTEMVTAILKALSAEADLLVLDLPGVTCQGAHAALLESDQILLVTEPETLALATARADLDVLSSWGALDRTKVVVVSRTPDEITLAKGEIERRLAPEAAESDKGKKSTSLIVATIPAAGEPLQEALRLREPLAVAMPNLSASKLFGQLSHWLTEPAPAPVIF